MNGENWETKEFWLYYGDLLQDEYGSYEEAKDVVEQFIQMEADSYEGVPECSFLRSVTDTALEAIQVNLILDQMNINETEEEDEYDEAVLE